MSKPIAGSFAWDGAYDSASSQGKRRQGNVTYQTEDQVLDIWQRAQSTENSVDLVRNFSVVNWMVNQHLNYVARFTFQGATKNQEFNRLLEQRIAIHSKKGNCEVTGQESFRTFLRNIERQRVLAGDFLTLMLDLISEGDPLGKLQGIEYDRVRNPESDGNIQTDQYPQWVQGVEISKLGRHLRYAVHRRVGGSFALDTIVDAAFACFAAYRFRTDQTRGVGLVNSAHNYLRDLHESIEANVLKMKVQSLFAVAFSTALDLSADGDSTPEELKKKRKPYSVNFGRGPMVIQTYPGDKAEFLTTKASDKEFREFSMFVLMLAMKALDLPYSMLDESFTNYTGHKAAWSHYEEASFEKRESLREICDRITLFWIAMDLRSGALVLPRGMKAEDIAWNWIPPARPWWKPQEEIQGVIAQLATGMTTFEQVVMKHGTGDIYSNIEANAKVMKFAEEKGFPITLANPGDTGMGSKGSSKDEGQTGE